MYKELKEKEPFSLDFHQDADGVYSACLLSSMFQLSKVNSPEIFGDYHGDVSVDLGRPLDPAWNGIAIDHHSHVKDGTQPYKLFFSPVPTGRIIYDHMKDKIPEEHMWKMVGSVVGDGQPELVPSEVWDHYKFLTDERGRIYVSRWETKFSSYFVYSLLPSAVNALCRLGNPLRAFEIVNNAKDPDDILGHQDVMDAQSTVQKEVKMIEMSKPSVRIINNKFAFVIIEPTKPEIRLEGLFASKLSHTMKKYTIGIINGKNGKVSIRGVFALYLADKLAEKDWQFGGHPGFCGGQVAPDDIDKLIATIKEVLT